MRSADLYADRIEATITEFVRQQLYAYWLTTVSVFNKDDTIAKISTLVGVAPLNRDSGQLQGKRTIYSGRAPVRQMLYMAILVAVRYNPVIKAFYDQLFSGAN